MRSRGGAGGTFGVVAGSRTVKLKTVVTMLAPGPKGVEPVAMVRSCTCAGPSVAPRMAVAETMPFAFEVDEALLPENDCGGCPAAAMFANGFPEESSALAGSGDGSGCPGGPCWSAPLTNRWIAGNA